MAEGAQKGNVHVIFATQSLADAMQSPIAVSFKESCPTKIFLPNASAHDALTAVASPLPQESSVQSVGM